ncbi:MAG: glutathione S-transferase N-terminal domain-containing protein [Thalassobaculaceae bacterium]
MILSGRPYSVYVRTVRLCLEEKGLDCSLVPVDPFARTETGSAMIDAHPTVRAWWQRLRARPSAVATAFPE